MLGCFSRLRRPTTTGSSAAPEPMPMPAAASEEASTSAASTTSAAGSTSPCSSSSSTRCNNKDDGHAGNDSNSIVPVGKNPSALSESGLSSAIASRRFFLSSPGRSNSIVDSTAHGAAAAAALGVVGVGAAGVAVPTYSPDPHSDFLRSMEEMVAALRLDARRRCDRARLHELLPLQQTHPCRYVLLSTLSNTCVHLTRSSS